MAAQSEYNLPTVCKSTALVPHPFMPVPRVIQAAKQGIRDSWSSWNPQRKAAHELQQLVQSGQISLQDTILAQRQVGVHSTQEPLAGSIPEADAKARGWVGHPKPFAWPAAKDAQVGGDSGDLTALCQGQDWL